MEDQSFKRNSYYHLRLIDFVASNNQNSEIKNKKESLANFLDGKETRDFYLDVISMPSTSKDFNDNNLIKSNEIKKTQISKFDGNILFNTILTFAQEGDVNNIEKCINSGLDINVQDMYGWTPLMCATCAGHYDTVKYLITKGADRSIKNKQNQTALDIAFKQNHSDIIKLLATFFCVKNEKTLHTKLDESKSRKSQSHKKLKYCTSCKLNYSDSTFKHERTIAHLFSTLEPKDSSYYYIPENNKGFQMMLRSGWDKNKGLGSKAEGRKFPIKTILKKDRSCIGSRKELLKVTHFGPYDAEAVKNRIVPRERTLKKWEREKIEKQNRQKEIDFRQEFNSEF